MLRIIKAVALAAIGFGLLFGGFVYDMAFAGIPYQDPTPEMQSSWDFHKFVATLFYKAGGLALLIGLITAPLVWWATGRDVSSAVDT